MKPRIWLLNVLVCGIIAGLGFGGRLKGENCVGCPPLQKVGVVNASMATLPLSTGKVNGVATARPMPADGNAGITTKPPIVAEKIADAIYLAEGGAKTSHPYGILKHYKNTSPRQACLNTINNNYRRWDGRGDFIDALARVYCPVGADNDPQNLNKNWAKNVKYFVKVSK
jgi:hypothetical protein